MTAQNDLDSLYSELPTLECKGLCQQSCGPVYMTRVEWTRIKTKLGWEPKGKDLTCPMLHRKSGKCRVYDIRPTLCRLWGIVEQMPCLWGCQPSKVLSNEEGYEFLQRAGYLGE